MIDEENKREEGKREKELEHKLYLLLRAYRELSDKVDRLERELEEYKGRVTAEESGRKISRETEQIPREKASVNSSKNSDEKKNSQKSDRQSGEKISNNAEKRSGKKKHLGKTIGTIAFYSFLVLMILGAVLVRSSSDGSPRSLAGFSAMLVLSGSMQSEIPKGSLVINRSVEPETLQIGDDITYLANSTTTVTHRIVDIIRKL